MTLHEVAGVTPPSAQFVHYHDALLQHLLTRAAGCAQLVSRLSAPLSIVFCTMLLQACL